MDAARLQADDHDASRRQASRRVPTAILGHKTSSGKTKEREKLAAVTEQHYNQSQKIALKAEGMALWVKALLAAYAKETRKFRDLRIERKAA
jgi:hypothetical protein